MLRLQGIQPTSKSCACLAVDDAVRERFSSTARRRLLKFIAFSMSTNCQHPAQPREATPKHRNAATKLHSLCCGFAFPRPWPSPLPLSLDLGLLSLGRRYGCCVQAEDMRFCAAIEALDPLIGTTQSRQRARRDAEQIDDYTTCKSHWISIRHFCWR